VRNANDFHTLFVLIPLAASNFYLISHLHARLPPLSRGSLTLRLHRLPAGARANRVRVHCQEDVAAAAYVLARAREHGAGQEIEL